MLLLKQWHRSPKQTFQVQLLPQTKVYDCITNEFLPALHYKYVFKNFKQSDLYQSYNLAVIPEYLQGRPKQTILHCLNRLASSNKFSHSDVSHVVPNSGKFTIKSKKGCQVVEFGDQSEEPRCTCKDWLSSSMQVFLLCFDTFQIGGGKSYLKAI